MNPVGPVTLVVESNPWGLLASNPCDSLLLYRVLFWRDDFLAEQLGLQLWDKSWGGLGNASHSQEKRQMLVTQASRVHEQRTCHKTLWIEFSTDSVSLYVPFLLASSFCFIFPFLNNVKDSCLWCIWFKKKKMTSGLFRQGKN